MRRRKRGHHRRRRLLLTSALVVGVLAVGVAALRDGAPPGATPRPAARSPVLATAPTGRVRVEVLNVGGVSGMARDATLLLRDIGFDVVDFGNIGNGASFDSTRASEVVDRVGRVDLARGVADALGIDNVRSEPDPNLYVDVSVLLGSDWTRPVAGRAEERRGGRAWWDPRSWLSR